jgi:hypothetical protein
MGIDVSGNFQAKEGGDWVFLKQYYDGQRGLLRWWLGWGPGGLYERYGGKPLVDELRGLPTDLLQKGCRESEYQSWLFASEILGALPLLGQYSYSVPRELARKASEQGATPGQWKMLTGIGDELDFLKQYGPVPALLSVTPNWEALSPCNNTVQVECVYDFSAEIGEFTTLVAGFCESHDDVRFIYSFE